MAFSFYWHDYETFGLDPRADRPAQFAGQRTDPDLNPVEQPLELWCRLSPDYLPHPAACGLTGIGPGAARRLGLCERTSSAPSTGRWPGRRPAAAATTACASMTR